MCVYVFFLRCVKERKKYVYYGLCVCVCVRTRGAEVYLLDEKVVCWVLGTVYCGFDVRNFVASFLFLGRYSRRRKKSLLCVCVCVYGVCMEKRSRADINLCFCHEVVDYFVWNYLLKLVL